MDFARGVWLISIWCNNASLEADRRRSMVRYSKLFGYVGAVLAPSLSGCAGAQSTLDPAGYHAQQIAQLWWWMLGVGIAVWLIMLALTYYAIIAKRRTHFRQWSVWVVIGGGVIFPSIILTTLLCFGLALLPRLLASPPEGSMTIEVEGLQWWWRVTYPETIVDGKQLPGFETANEICIPVDQPVQFHLRSGDVIHAFWIPALGGKVDMIPGRVTRLTVHPFKTGRYRGVCAEFCGESHALMNFDVRIVSRVEFEDWLAAQALPVNQPHLLSPGSAIFESSGCGACHMIDGTSSQGRVGPNLTHFGSRLSVGAGIFANDRASIIAWLRSTEHIKPGVHMPNFSDLGDSQLNQLASYLEQLP